MWTSYMLWRVWHSIRIFRTRRAAVCFDSFCIVCPKLHKKVEYEMSTPCMIPHQIRHDQSRIKSLYWSLPCQKYLRVLMLNHSFTKLIIICKLCYHFPWVHLYRLTNLLCMTLNRSTYSRSNVLHCSLSKLDRVTTWFFRGRCSFRCRKVHKNMEIRTAALCAQ